MITNGVVSVEDGNKAAEEYAPARKVRVELTFATQEDGSESAAETLERVSSIADAKVKELLGRKPAKQPAKTEVVTAEVAVEPKVSKPKKAAKEAATELSDKEKLAIAAGVLATDTPAQVVEKLAEPEPDSLDDLLGEQAPVPITDAELAKAAQNKNGQMKAKDPNFSVKIRALVVEYAGPPPKKITDVPVAKRQEFLDKLRDLS